MRNLLLFTGQTDTYSELSERKPWKESGAASEIWLLLRSLKQIKFDSINSSYFQNNEL